MRQSTAKLCGPEPRVLPVSLSAISGLKFRGMLAKVQMFSLNGGLFPALLSQLSLCLDSSSPQGISWSQLRFHVFQEVTSCN